jgi:hypothetical protein
MLLIPCRCRVQRLGLIVRRERGFGCRHCRETETGRRVNVSGEVGNAWHRPVVAWISEIRRSRCSRPRRTRPPEPSQPPVIVRPAGERGGRDLSMESGDQPFRHARSAAQVRRSIPTPLRSTSPEAFHFSVDPGNHGSQFLTSSRACSTRGTSTARLAGEIRLKQPRLARPFVYPYQTSTPGRQIQDAAVGSVARPEW